MKKLVLFIFFIPQFIFSQIIEKEITDWEFRMVGDSLWKKATVPGTIIDNFVDLSNISNPLHPYYGDNEKLYQWIGEKDWEYRTQVNLHELTKDKNYTYDIEFESLDLFAEVNINGNKYKSNNAFLPLVAPNYTDSVLNINIIFYSTQNKVLVSQKNDTLKIPGGERVYARTPQYQFGWDWGPKFVNMGIRKPVTLKMFKKNDINISIQNLKQTAKKNNEVIVEFDTEIITKYPTVNICFTKYENGRLILSDTSSTDIINGHSKINSKYYKIKLWWPNGSGKLSNNYEFDIKVTLPGDTTVIAHEHFYYAACDIKLIQEKDKLGESFYFTVNGEKVFAKGANYIPDDSFDPGKNTKQLVQLAAGANMNMLRVWGGGTYPDKEFYIECMKNGIMVWQDFMFACSMNPGNQDFLNSVADEAGYQVERLKEFNNIAVWCGNNENEEGWRNWGWQKDLNIHGEDSAKMWFDYDVIFNKILPETIGTANQLYGTHFNYISTSPKHGWGRNESMTEGDSHYWGVWWGLEPIEKYNEKVPRFMSEFGMQGMPDLETLKKVIPDSAMNFDSPLFKNHQKHPTGFQTLNHYLKEYLVIPDNMEDYAYATQVLQAYALTTAIEAQRRAMPYCMGSLIWQLNDCWPVTSWSLVDSELKRKIAYKEVSKAFYNSIVSIKEENEIYNVYLINDNNLDANLIEMNLSIKDFYGKELYSKRAIRIVKKNTSGIIYTINKKSLEQIDLTTVYLTCDIYMKHRANSMSITPTYYFHFVKPNELKLPKSEFKIIQENGMYQIETNVYCPYFLLPEHGEYPVEYWWNLEPGKYHLFNNLKYINSLKDHLNEIKCLNNLLNK